MEWKNYFRLQIWSSINGETNKLFTCSWMRKTMRLRFTPKWLSVSNSKWMSRFVGMCKYLRNDAFAYICSFIFAVLMFYNLQHFVIQVLKCIVTEVVPSISYCHTQFSDHNIHNSVKKGNRYTLICHVKHLLVKLDETRDITVIKDNPSSAYVHYLILHSIGIDPSVWLRIYTMVFPAY